ncbi:MAG: hypothetical protein KDC71_24065, partial [Acidobacteria bacterium]|nr:hypothetical protein [Acidobacteriota bacterium]
MQEHSPPVSFDPANWRWAGLHLALGIVAFLYPPILGLSLLAPALFFFLGWFKPDPIWFLFGLGYVLGAEVLWRMSMLPLPWELSKYLALIFAVGWLFRHPGPRKNSVWLGFCMLLPSCLLAPDLKSVRFAMLGLFVFTVWLWLLPSKSKAENLPFLKCLNVILLPLITMLGLSAMGILYALLHWQANLNAQELFIWFYRMKFASFGFGPNQVAWHYALGFLLCGLAYSRAKHPGQYFVLGLIFLFFCVATFSRGPFWVCILVAFWLGQGSLRSKALVLVLFGAFVSVVLGSGIWVRMTHFADSIRWKNAV